MKGPGATGTRKNADGPQPKICLGIGCAFFAANHLSVMFGVGVLAEALMMGSTASEPHRAYPGNRPSTMLVLPEADAFHLGMLVALYEHKVYAASVIWDINAFDQWGVELGKQLAGRIQSELSTHSPQAAPGTHDASTTALIHHIKTNAGRPA